MLAERRRRRPSDSDDDPVDTAYKEKVAAVEARIVAEENLRKVSALYKDAKKSANHWEIEAKCHMTSIEDIRESNRRLTSNMTSIEDIREKIGD